MRVSMGPTGQVIRGHLLDVSVKPFLRTLQDYDSQLYVKWNPRKLNGWGAWEIRRRPNEKRIKDIVTVGNASFVVLDWVEYDIESVILTVPYLNYLVMTKLRSIDSWNGNRHYWVDQLESAEKSRREDLQRQRQADMRYAAKQYKTEIRAFKEMINSGLNPNRLADVWSKAKI